MGRVAINGLGRIGRAVFKILFDTPGLDVVAVNDIAPWDNLVYLLRFDTVYGRWDRQLQLQGDILTVDGAQLKALQERDPTQLPWAELGVDVVFECTGVFTKSEDMQKHVQAGARYAILSAPSASADVPTVIHGVNRVEPSSRMMSCASCTTNSITPVVEILERRFGIKKAIMTTIHGYTATQRLVDLPHKKWRRGRAAAANLVPTTTGAAKATAKALPYMAGRFDGVAVRVPVPVGSLSDMTFVLERATTVDEVNQVFREEAASERYRGIFGATEDEIVSSDIIMDARASVVDLEMTRVVDGNLVKVMAWYDNEWGYANQMVRQALTVAEG